MGRKKCVQRMIEAQQKEVQEKMAKPPMNSYRVITYGQDEIIIRAHYFTVREGILIFFTNEKEFREVACFAGWIYVMELQEENPPIL
jgi:hypothetical protein